MDRTEIKWTCGPRMSEQMEVLERRRTGLKGSMAGLADFAGFMSQETVCAMTAAGGEFVMLESALTQIPFRPDPTSCLPQIAS
jgi:hypothetical protein